MYIKVENSTENKMINNLNKLTSFIMEFMTVEDRLEWEAYLNTLKRMSPEKMKSELRELAKEMIVTLEQELNTERIN